MRTKTVLLHGSSTASKSALALINRSVFFTMTPLPDDAWELVVKAEQPIDNAGIPLGDPINMNTLCQINMGDRV